MLQTPLCTLLGIEFPIIQTGMGVFTSAELARQCDRFIGRFM
jgi:NAD(P)H-dependent flavin oxidoreductase YrpB (nitropropane dioxygenase family)